jgi:hypothetical protein
VLERERPQAQTSRAKCLLLPTKHLPYEFFHQRRCQLFELDQHRNLVRVYERAELRNLRPWMQRQVLQLAQPVQQELLGQQELPESLEPLVCKSLGWKPELQLGEPRAQVAQPGVQLGEPRVQAAQLEALPVLALQALL